MLKTLTNLISRKRPGSQEMAGMKRTYNATMLHGMPSWEKGKHSMRCENLLCRNRRDKFLTP
eukprot:8609558-Prorocentrum_lima.AAC.1